MLLLLASVYSFLQDSSESEYANESNDSGLAKNRLDFSWSSVTGESGGVTSTQFSSFIRCCIETTSMTCTEKGEKKNIFITIDIVAGKAQARSPGGIYKDYVIYGIPTGILHFAFFFSK